MGPYGVKVSNDIPSARTHHIYFPKFILLVRVSTIVVKRIVKFEILSC